MERQLSQQLSGNLAALKEMFGSSLDYYAKEMEICGVPAAVVLFDGLTDLESLWRLLPQALRASGAGVAYLSGPQLFERILYHSDLLAEPKPVQDFPSAVQRLTGGFGLLFLEGCGEAIAFSVQGMKARGVEQPSGEGNIRGSREGFADLLRINASLLRRLIRTEALVMEADVACDGTCTEYALCYDRTRAAPAMVEAVRQRLKTATPKLLLDSSYFVPWLCPARLRLFTPVSYTERPAVAAAKLREGKIVVLVNGSPSALIMPCLFSEHFDCLDDYGGTAAFASFIRLLKYFSFYLTILFPACFVTAALYTPEILPPDILAKVAAAEQATPFPLFAEMLLVILLLEMIREAGLRMPQSLGNSVSLVSALIIGDAAISTGLLSTPCILVGAVTSIGMFLTPSLYEPATILRMLFLLAGGFAGPVGLAFGLVALLLTTAGVGTLGVPFTDQLMPLKAAALRDGLIRRNYRALSKERYTVEEDETGEENR